MITQAEIYTKLNCKYCNMAKRTFAELNIPYKEFIIGLPEDSKLEPHQQRVTREDLLARVPLAKTVPQIWLDGTHVGGYEELAVHPLIRGE